MSKFEFQDPETGHSFSVTVPPGVNLDQAKAIFLQQQTTGALTGLKVGSVVSAANQAAQGLTAALPSVTQSIATAAQNVGSATNTITAQIGAAGSAAAQQIASAAKGLTAASGTTSLSSFAQSGIDSAVKLAQNLVQTTAAAGVSLTPALSTAASFTASAVTKAGTALGTQLAGASGLAQQTVQTLNTALNQTPVTAPINVAALVNQGTQSAVQLLTAPQTQAAMTAAAGAVGQAAESVSDSLGVGKFGLNTAQLEKSGYLKPGTASFGFGVPLAQLLQSPTVWTGKDNVKDLAGIVSNPALQNNIQQNLMNSGINDLAALGVPMDKLNAQAVAGLANNAARSVTDTVKNLQNLPVSSDIKAQFDNLTKNTAFAVQFTDTKVSEPVVNETTPEPARDSVDAATVTAAAERVVGNPKVPAATETTGPSGPGFLEMNVAWDWIKGMTDNLILIEKSVTALLPLPEISESQYSTVAADYQAQKEEFNAKYSIYQRNVIEAIKKMPDGRNKDNVTASFVKFKAVGKRLAELSEPLNNNIKKLAARVVLRSAE